MTKIGLKTGLDFALGLTYTSVVVVVVVVVIAIVIIIRCFVLSPFFVS
jgi:uncharacterized transporter YbjL